MEENKLFENDVNQAELEDAFFAVEILRKALELRPYIREGILGEKFKNLSREKQLEETLTPRITFSFVDIERNIPMLFFRFVGDSSPILEAVFYPIEAIMAFVEEARNVVNNFTNIPQKEEERKEIVFSFALEMTLILLDNFYRRAEITMDHIPIEVIGQWHNNKQQEILHSESERGNKPTRYKNPLLDRAISNQQKEISRFWKYQGQTREDWRKMDLADEYDALTKHWKRLLKISGEDDVDVQDYATGGKFNDTPQDLISKLMNIDRFNEETTTMRVSELALEHAARRVGLIKKRGVSEFARNKRKEGIKVSDYSSQQLFNFLKEGRELKTKIEQTENFLAQIETEDNFEQASESALIKKRNLLEQKLKFVQEETEKQLEQKAESALTENS